MNKSSKWGDFWLINQYLVNEIGVEGSFLIAYLSYRDNSNGEEWFKVSIKDVEGVTGFGRKKQDRLISKI